MAFSQGIVNGTDVKVYIGGQLVGCATSHSIERSTSVREVACKDSGNWMGKEYGRNSWTCSIEALVNPYTGDGKFKFVDFVQKFTEGEDVTIVSSYTDPSTGDTLEFTGKGVIASTSETYGDAENASYSISIEGNGELSEVGVDYFYVDVVVSNGTADYINVTGLGEAIIVPASADGTTTLLVKGTSGADTYDFTAYNNAGQIDTVSSAVTSNNTQVPIALP